MKQSPTLVVSTVPFEVGSLPIEVLRPLEFLEAAPDPAERPVVNLVEDTSYLSEGYYVSLVAEARGLPVWPSIHCLEGMGDTMARNRALREAEVDVLDGDEVAARLRTMPGPPPANAPPVAEEDGASMRYRAPKPEELVTITLFLGRTEVAGFHRLGARVFRAWSAPILRMSLVRELGAWRLFDLRAIPLASLNNEERATLAEVIARIQPAGQEPDERRIPSLAVLYDPQDPYKASTPETIDRLERVARRRGLRIERLGLDDVHRLGDHDALFIRTLTGLDQPSYRFAMRAAALGMPVMDDPRSIVRCSNKVFLYELLKREGLAMPRTVIVARDTRFDDIVASLGLPFVLKVPDGSFSASVFKIGDPRTFSDQMAALADRSPLLVAQAFVRTGFDWRITVLDGRVLFAARYHMVAGHWQIRSLAKGSVRYGRVEAVPRDKAPREVVKLALKATGLIGDGIYGVDLKELDDGPVVIEVNDNPNLDTGYDDAVDGDVIYEDLISWYLRRIPRERARRPAPKPAQAPPPDDAQLAPLRAPIGRAVREQSRPWRAYEVMGLEIEYPVVDRDLNAVSKVGPLMADLAGRPTSDVDLGLVGISNEIVDHVLELKNSVPLRSLARIEEVLLEGVRRASVVLAARHGARLLPCGMHPWLDPKKTKLWNRSNRKIYQTYARLFDVTSHGWANVQAVHVNLPVGRPEEAVSMMNAAAMLVPYLPAITASSPMFDGEIQPAVDNRLAWIIEHQSRLPESAGKIVPEPIDSLAAYRRDVLKPMYQAVDRLPDAGAVRHEFLNARGAVFKFSRESMEIRVIDVQECVHLDVAIAGFVRRALRWLAGELDAGRIQIPSHDLLVEDFQATVREGSEARVQAPHLEGARGEDGKIAVRDALAALVDIVSRRAPAEEKPYLAEVARMVEQGSLSECLKRALAPWIDQEEGFTEAARRVWIELAECLVENRPWEGRARFGRGAG